MIAGGICKSDPENDERGEHTTNHPAVTFATAPDVPPR